MLLRKKFSSTWFDLKNLGRTITAVALFPASLAAGLTYIQSEFAQLTAAKSQPLPVAVEAIVVNATYENREFPETDMAGRYRTDGSKEF